MQQTFLNKFQREYEGIDYRPTMFEVLDERNKLLSENIRLREALQKIADTVNDISCTTVTGSVLTLAKEALKPIQ